MEHSDAVKRFTHPGKTGLIWDRIRAISIPVLLLAPRTTKSTAAVNGGSAI
jgi:hypothetical protein